MEIQFLRVEPRAKIMKRDRAIAIVNQLPKDFDVDDLIERLIFVDKVEKGIRQADLGITRSTQDVRQSFKKKIED
jgi:hypothetical protein